MKIENIEPPASGYCKSRTAIERFNAFTDQNGPVSKIHPELGNCWVWTGGKNREKNGYGNFKVDGRSVRAHKWIYELNHGKVEDPKLVVKHKCANSVCVRLSHLFVGTQQSNILQAIEEGTWGDRRGLNSPSGKLTKEQVLDIREKCKTMPQKEVAKLYGLSKSCVSNIVNLVTYSDVDSGDKSA